MGWSIGWASKKALVAELLENKGGNCEILDHALVGNNLWALAKQRADNGVKFVVLYKLGYYRNAGGPGGDWGYKVIEEASGPFEYNCPKRLIDAADAPYNEYAAKWREGCAKARAHKGGAASKKFIDGLKRGDVFYWQGERIEFLFFYTTRKGARRIAGMPGKGGTYRYPASQIRATPEVQA